jgi:hypothetical protein
VLPMLPASAGATAVKVLVFFVLFLFVKFPPWGGAKTNLGKAKISFSEKLLTCELKKGIKAVRFMRVRSHGSSMAQSCLYQNFSPNYDYTVIFDL